MQIVHIEKYTYEPNSALCVFTAAFELEFHIPDPKAKIVQNINFLSVCQNSDLISKLEHIHQPKSSGMLGFQKRARDINLLKIRINRDNQTYIEKLVC